MNLWLDVRYAVRTLRQNRGFTIVSALTLALGIGANTAMFSIIRAVFLRALPIPHEERLVKLWQSDPEKGLAQGLVSPADFVDWEAQNQVFEQLGAWPGIADSVSAFNIVSKGNAERVRGMYASSGFFRTLGVQPVLGRTFLPEEDRRQDENHRAALLSHAYWRERFGADPAILEKTIEVDTFRGGVYKIVGVLPPAFDFPRGTQVFLPLAFWGGGPLPYTDAPVRCCPWFAVVGRLKAGVNMARAERETTAIARRVSARHREAAPVAAVKITPFREDMVARYRLGLFALFGAVACVLLICCVNVANLVLSRVLARRGEMAIRVALGATTGRLARQILVESLVLSALGAGAGMLGGAWVQGLLAASMAGSIPLASGARMDLGVFAFGFGITVVTGCLCGLAAMTPLAASKLQTPLRSENSLRGSALWQVLVVCEVSLAVALVGGAGLLIRSLAQIHGVDPGFRTRRVLAMSFDFSSGPFMGPGNQQPYFRELMNRVAGLPGVRAVGAISEPPLRRRQLADQPITLEDQPVRTALESPHVISRAVTPDYFAVMGIPLQRGRTFTEGDSSDGNLVALVNETAARLFWRGGDPIGKRIAMGSRDRFNYFRISERAKAGLPEWREIVGVVADVRSSGLDLAPQPEVFYSYRQYPWYGPTLVMRADSDPLRLVAAIRREAATLNSRAVVTEVTTMDQIAADSIAEPRIRAQLTGGFSAMALVLGMLGIYGVTSYTVTRRTREIGVRMALGARRADVSWLVIRQALQATAIGLAVGIGGALAAARYISSLLYGVRPADPVTLAGTCVLFAVAALGASLVPAQRAARLDPASALRQG